MKLLRPTKLHSLLSLLSIIMVTVSGCVSVDLMSLLNPALREFVIQKSQVRTKNKILVVDITGIITSDSISKFLISPICSSEKVKAVLNKAERDPRIRGVILRIDSPGGEVTASDVIHHEILDFRKRTGIPVLASLMGLATSGGYYIACAADAIYAHPTTVTGSIGVIARFPKLVGLADKIGYREEIITSGDFKTIGHPLRDMTSEERKLLQDNIDGMYQRFLEVVVASRPHYRSADQLRPVADGRIYTARQAVSTKLIDGVGYISGVVEKTKQKASIRDADVVTYLAGFNADSNIYSAVRANRKLSPNVIHVDFGLDSYLPNARPGFYYLWLPEL